MVDLFHVGYATILFCRLGWEQHRIHYVGTFLTFFSKKGYHSFFEKLFFLFNYFFQNSNWVFMTFLVSKERLKQNVRLRTRICRCIVVIRQYFCRQHTKYILNSTPLYWEVRTV